MAKLSYLVMAAAIVATCAAAPDDVDDFNRMSSNLVEKTKTSGSKTSERKVVTEVELKSTASEHSTFLSNFLHEGHNLFFKPQILLGSTISNPKSEESVKEVLITSGPEIILENNEGCGEIVAEEPSDIPAAPMLTPLAIPEPPAVVVEVVEEEPCPPADEVATLEEMSVGKETIIVPEPPAMFPLNPPKLPVQILPQPVPVIAPCPPIYDFLGASVPCSASAVLPEVVGVDALVEKQTVIESETPTILSASAAFDGEAPVATVAAHSERVVGIAEHSPAFRVSTISMEDYSRQNVVKIQDTIYPEVLVERTFEEVLPTVHGASSFSAYCAHNIALERVLPNIVTIKRLIAEPLLELPARPVVIG